MLVQLGTQTALERDKMVNDKEMLKLALDAENKLLNDISISITDNVKHL